MPLLINSFIQTTVQKAIQKTIQKIILSTLSIVLLSPELLLKSAYAETLPTMPIQFNPDTLVNPGRPGGRRRGGGSRGGCQAEIPLTAIAYVDSRTVAELGVTRTEETVGMLTTQAQPTLWFYLPAPLSANTPTEFMIKDGLNRTLFQAQLSGETAQPGIIGVPVSFDLEVGKPYHWFFTVGCDDTEQTTVDGWIQRRTVNPNLSRIFDQGNPHNRAALYASYGFLQDALSELAAMRLAHQDNANEDDASARSWTHFLSTLGLTEIATAPVLDCCALTQPTADPQP